MAALQGKSSLEFFREKKEQPIIRFLTWYIVLVEGWSFEDIKEMVGKPMTLREIDGVKCACHSWSFTFHTGRLVKLVLVENERGEFSVHSSSQEWLTQDWSDLYAAEKRQAQGRETAVSEKTHDGTLDAGENTWTHAKAEYSPVYLESEWRGIVINGGYGDIESNHVSLDAQQALSLLAWLRQEESTLQALAKGQNA